MDRVADHGSPMEIARTKPDISGSDSLAQWKLLLFQYHFL